MQISRLIRLTALAGIVALGATIGTETALADRGSDDSPGHHRGGDDDPGGDDSSARGGKLGDRRGGGSRVRKEFTLVAAPAGAGMRLKGKARTETRGSREKVKVEVESRALPAGTTLEVWFTNPRNSLDPFLLGILTLQPGSPGEVQDEIEVKNWDTGILPPGASPVNEITAFEVRSPSTGAVLMTSTPGRVR